jgi:hypothetical protein
MRPAGRGKDDGSVVWTLIRSLRNRTELTRPKPSRLEEIRRLIEEYANDLRKIVKKLRRQN